MVSQLWIFPNTQQQCSGLMGQTTVDPSFVTLCQDEQIGTIPGPISPKVCSAILDQPNT